MSAKNKIKINLEGTNNYDTVLYTLIYWHTCTHKCLLHIELWMYIHRCQSASRLLFVPLSDHKAHDFIQSVIKHSWPYHTLRMAFCFHKNIHHWLQRQVQPGHSIQQGGRFLSHDAKSVHSSRFNCKPKRCLCNSFPHSICVLNRFSNVTLKGPLIDSWPTVTVQPAHRLGRFLFPPAAETKKLSLWTDWLNRRTFKSPTVNTARCSPPQLLHKARMG